MSEYQCEYCYKVQAEDKIEERTRFFLENVFGESLKYTIEYEGNEARIYPKDIRSAAVLVTLDIRAALSIQGKINESPDFPSAYMSMETHYFIPKDYGVIKRATASGEPGFEFSEKFKSLERYPLQII